MASHQWLVVAGLTSPGATVTVNGRKVNIEPDGRFQAEALLDPGNHGDDQGILDRLRQFDGI